MGSHIQTTGDVEADIDTIIQQINTIYSSEAMTNALNIAAYGSLQITVPQAFGTFTSQFRHNLGYAPMYMAFINASNEYVFLPWFPASYSYNSGAKTPGTYPIDNVIASTDNTFLTVYWTNLPNPTSEIIFGTYTINFFLFSRPITS